MKRSKNVLGFFGNTKERFRGLHSRAIVATLITVLPFMLVLCGAAWLTH